MKIYFAGVPGGDQAQREQELYSRFQERLKRLVSFFYEDQTRVTIQGMEKTRENLLCRK